MNTTAELEKLAFEHGQTVSGPIFSAFTNWILEKADSLQIDTILFLARDGQLPFKIAQARNPSQKIHYVPASRASWYPCAPLALGPEMIFERIRNEYETAEGLCNALGISVDAFRDAGFPTNKKLRNSEIHKACRFLFSPKGKVLVSEAASERRSLFLGYLENLDGFDRSKRIAIVDIGWKGSLQAVLDHTLREQGYEIPIHGFYLGIRHKQNSKFYHGFAYANRMTPHWLEAYPSVVEMLTPAEHGSVTAFVASDVGIKPVYTDNPVVAPNLARKLHDGAVHFASQSPIPSRKTALALLKRTIQSPPIGTVKLYANFQFESTLFALEGDPLVRKLSLGEISSLLTTWDRKYREWPWPAASLKLSNFWFPGSWLTLKFYAYSVLKALYHKRIVPLARPFKKPDLISIDIFDTVLFRYVKRPTDIFNLVESQCKIPGFANARIEAENKSRSKVPSGEVSLSDIYRELAYSFSPEEIDTAREAELAIEAQNLHSKSNRWIQNLRKTEATIIYLSDMYLPSIWLQEQLQKSGLFEHGDRVIVSCEHDASKRTGTLFQIVLNEYQPRRWLHFGDNPKADFISAMRNGASPRLRIAKSTFQYTARQVLRLLFS